jgi:hypothetical protein
MGLLRKQPKQPQPSDWIQPAQAISQLGGPGGPPGSGGPPVPVRLRPVTADGRSGNWLPGALHLTPGSISWQPDAGVSAQAVELATATMLPPQGKLLRGIALITDVQTPVGRFELEMDPVMFEMSQELVAGAGQQPPDADPGLPGYPGFPG